jgi:hypothetical protein
MRHCDEQSRFADGVVSKPGQPAQGGRYVKHWGVS